MPLTPSPRPAYLMQSPPGARTLINDRWRDYFAGCSYLGLQNHPGLLGAAAQAIGRYGLGTATSRGGYGEHPLYSAVEAAAARFFGAERATYFVTGYLGNAILAQGLAGQYEHIFLDEAAHFSVRDGARTVDLPMHTFRHCDGAALAASLREHLRPGERPLVFSDGVFPISGEIAPLPAYVAALVDYPGAILCLDDAHAGGVLGERGRGTVEHWQELHPQGLTISGAPAIHTSFTLSKALGGHGGVIAGDAAFIETLAQHATAPGGTSPAVLPAAAASAWALDYAAAQPDLRRQLAANVALARAGLRGLGWELPDSPVPIICLGARPEMDLARLQAELFGADICVSHVTRYTSTPPGGALRIAIFATHSREQIERLVAELAKLL